MSLMGELSHYINVSYKILGGESGDILQESTLDLAFNFT
jgi:hypothetical protein